jgi:DNA-binding transcriptional regulator YhcF (GntR family)
VSPTKPPVRSSPADDALRKLIALIEDGALAIGTFLPAERQLAERWSLSRVVVREAARKLEQRGLVSIRHGIGVEVTNNPALPVQHTLERLLPSDKERLRQCAQARLLIEPELAATAAVRATPKGLRALKANCVAQACHEFNISRTTHEIAEAFGIPARDLSRTYDIFQEQIPDGDVNMTMPADLISRFFNDITTVPEMDRGRTKMKIISTCRRLEPSIALMGRMPKAVAAAVMYVMLTPLVTKPDICRICDVSCPTLNKLELIVKGELKEMQQL